MLNKEKNVTKICRNGYNLTPLIFDRLHFLFVFMSESEPPLKS